MTEPKRIMKVVPGWDCIRVQPCVHGSEKCKPGTGGSHGRHPAELFMSVLGHEAEVVFSMLTGWYPVEGVRPAITGGIEVTWHTAWPQESQTSEDRNAPNQDAACKDWTECYTQRAYGPANMLYMMLVEKGSESVYEWLEAEYQKLVKGT